MVNRIIGATVAAVAVLLAVQWFRSMPAEAASVGYPQRVASFDAPAVVTWDGGGSTLLDGGSASFPSDPIPFLYESGGLLVCPLSTLPPTNATVTFSLQGTADLTPTFGGAQWVPYPLADAGCTSLDGGGVDCAMDFAGVHAQWIRFVTIPGGDGGALGSSAPCELNRKSN